MAVQLIFSGVIAVMLLGYLVYTMLFPEKF
jgi:K+-transporting ATPase KdpF subunit